MSRRDKKGRKLNIGESQRADGRYFYSYRKDHKVLILDSCTLVDTDPWPVGKRPDKSLRTKIAELKNREESGIKKDADKITVKAIIDTYINLRTPVVRKNTVRNYESERNRIANTGIYMKRIGELDLLTCKEWALELKASGLAYDTIKKTVSLLKSALDIAVENDWLVKNPCDFKLSKCIGKGSSEKRFPLNEVWKEKYLDFVFKSDTYCYYYDSIYVLLNTGLRIAEFCALTKQDINFKKGFISVTKQLLISSGEGRYIETTKTCNGIRKIPIKDGVRKILKRKIREISSRTDNPTLDGFKNFLFLSKSDTLMDSRVWGKIFRRIYAEFKKEYPEYEKQDEYSPITAHILRHTFCTDLVKAHVDEKTITSIVGHSSFKTTMDIYTYYDFSKISEDFLVKTG